MGQNWILVVIQVGGLLWACQVLDLTDPDILKYARLLYITYVHLTWLSAISTVHEQQRTPM